MANIPHKNKKNYEVFDLMFPEGIYRNATLT